MSSEDEIPGDQASETPLPTPPPPAPQGEADEIERELARAMESVPAMDPGSDKPQPGPTPSQKEEVARFRPQPTMDAALQRELDDALGDLSLEDLIDQGTGTAERGTGEGVRRGTVIAIQGEDIFVDLGGRSEGLLSGSQFRDEPLPVVGDRVEVVIEGYDASEGLLMLSREGAIQAATWETVEEGAVVEGRVTGHNKGGLELLINGIRAFMPISQIEIFRVEDLGPYLNEKLTCKVIEVDRADKNLVVSRREMMEEEAAQRREEMVNSLSEGKTVKGTVRSIMPYGAFVDLGGVDGLLHVSDMSHRRVEDPSEIVHEGQQIEVMILKVDLAERKISLGLKQTLPDPWATADMKFPVDDVVTGRVSKLMDFGAFVELEEGVEGLIPMSEFTFERRIAHASEIVNVGDTVKVRILNVDMDRKRIGLSLKRVGDDPWLGASVRWPVDSVVEGIVTRLADFGAFIELGTGVEGLIHISELSE